MKKINLAISGCMGRMGQQLIKSSKKNKNFKLVTLTENRLVNKKFNGIKPELNSDKAFKKTDVIIDFTVPNCTLEILKIASKLRKKVVIGTTGFTRNQENQIKKYSKKIAILKAGTSGALASIINSVSSEAGPVNNMYFWLTGILSSFLDNAPTYLVFFNTAGGDAQILMGELSQTLLAISAGAVFMGANTYIGNAPNFMVKSIAESSGIEMPSFFGYFLYSIIILFPLFAVVSLIFF